MWRQHHSNFYFSPGTTNKRVSFPHEHEYNVIVKPIYGNSTWQINGEVFENSAKSFIKNESQRERMVLAKNFVSPIEHYLIIRDE